jgi:hypothetical protein
MGDVAKKQASYADLCAVREHVTALSHIIGLPIRAHRVSGMTPPSTLADRIFKPAFHAHSGVSHQWLLDFVFALCAVSIRSAHGLRFSIVNI